MQNQYQTLYSTWGAIEEIFSSEDHSEFKTAVHDYFNIVLDITNDDLNNLAINDLFQLLYTSLYSSKRNVVALKEEFFDCFDEQSVNAIAGDIVILDEDIKSCEALRKKKGIFILSEKDLTPLQNLFSSDAYTIPYNHQYQNDGTIDEKAYANFGWICALNNGLKFNVGSIISNSVVIVDNYLFKTSISEAIENVVSLCKKIIPKELEEPFHLTIATYNEEKLLDGKVESIERAITDRLNNEFTCGIQFELIAHNIAGNLHDRYFHTNYYSIRTSTGFDTFRGGTSRRREKVETGGNWAFIKLNHQEGFLHERCLNFKYIQEAYNKNPKYGTTVVEEFNYGAVHNRLFWHY